MAIGDIKTFTIEYDGLTLTVKAIDLGDGKVEIAITCDEGYCDLNAIYWGDGDGTAGEGTMSGFDGKKDSALNMNGSGEAWDAGMKLSSAGLGKDGVNKSTYMTAGETMNAFKINANWDDLNSFGVRATSTSTEGGSIKGVGSDPVVTPLPTVSIDDAACVTEGGVSTFTVKLTNAYDYDVEIEYKTSGGTATEGSDYTGQTGKITIKAGDTSATIEVQTVDDSEVEGAENEHFTLELVSASVHANIDDDEAIELNFNLKITDESGEGCIIDNDTGGGGGGGGPTTDHFPTWSSPSISHVTFYFDTPDGFVYDKKGAQDVPGSKGADGWYTVKFDVTGTQGPEVNDLDNWFQDALALIYAEVGDISAYLSGAAIKGGTSEIWYDFDNTPDDPDTPPSVFKVENNGVDNADNTVAWNGSAFVFA